MELVYDSFWIGAWPPQSDFDQRRHIPKPWVPFPTVYLGEWCCFPWTSTSAEASNLVRRTNRAALAAEVTKGEEITQELLRERLRSLEASANGFYRRLLLDAPELFCELRTIGQQLADEAHAPIEWSALDHATVEPVPIGDLSTAQRRWAQLAIDAALHEVETYLDSFLPQREGFTLLMRTAFERVAIVDEPEAGLHSSAQKHMAEALSGGCLPGAMTIVATHSAALLAAQGARLMHVTRDAMGTAVVRDLHPIVANPLDVASRLGLTPAELLQLTRLWLLVEGAHDEIVFRGLIGDELSRMGARILRMDGAKGTAATLDSQLLFDYTDAKVLVVLDNSKVATTLWRQAVSCCQVGERREALRIIDPLRDGSQEEKWLFGLLKRSIDTTLHHRVSCYGMAEADILFYLPVATFVPQAGSWQMLREERDEVFPTTRFKEFLRNEKHATTSQRHIERVVQTMDVVPEDIALVLQHVRDLLELRPSANILRNGESPRSSLS